MGHSFDCQLICKKYRFPIYCCLYTLEHPEIGALFKPETIHILDYDLEYDEGYPDEAKFPEFNNSVFRFFNSDTSMCTGFFKFGDLESGATMNLKVLII